MARHNGPTRNGETKMATAYCEYVPADLALDDLIDHGFQVDISEDEPERDIFDCVTGKTIAEIDRYGEVNYSDIMSWIDTQTVKG